MDNPIEIYDQINSLFSPSDIDMLEKFEEIKAKVEILTKERNEALKPILEKYYAETGNNTIKTDRLTIVYKKPHTRKQVDSAALKEQGLYDAFTREVEVSSSVSVSINYD